MARLRHSWLGSVQPQRAARSPGDRHGPRRHLEEAGVGHRPEVELAVLHRHARRRSATCRSRPASRSCWPRAPGTSRDPRAISPMPFDASSTSVIDVRTLPSWRLNFVRAVGRAGRAAPGGDRGRDRVSSPVALAAIAPSSRTSATRSGPAVVGFFSRSVEDSIAVTPTSDDLRRRAGERRDRSDLATDERQDGERLQHERVARGRGLVELVTRAALIRPRPSPRISWAGPRSCCADSSWSRPFWACRRGLEHLESRERAPRHDDHDDAGRDHAVAAAMWSRRRRPGRASRLR